MTQNKATNVILFTSSISNEGKTFCSMNLALMYALSGKKTILLGCDLRKQKITRDFNLNKEVGITSYLIGSYSEKEIIQNSGVLPTLDIMLAGPKPPNPAELLMNDRMEQLLSYLKNEYDYVIIDSPPIGIVTDGMILTKFADIVIYVIRQNVTKRLHIDFINNLHNEHKIKNLSIILNAVDSKGGGYGYGYGYGYGNGNGYGYYDEDIKKKNFLNFLKKINLKKVKQANSYFF